MKVKRCFSFSDQNSTVELVDENGCPEPSIMSEFRYVIAHNRFVSANCMRRLLLTVNLLILYSYDRPTGTAEAKLFSMFKFPDSNRVHFQCDIVICKGEQKISAIFHFLNLQPIRRL